MTRFDIAVIIPALNEEKFIGRCLDSVLEQSYPFDKMDIMVIDGGSSDRTREIVHSYHSKHSNIRLLSNPGRIQSIAFNIGVNNSDAPYIVRLDAHATYNKEYIATCYELLLNNPRYGNVGGVLHILPQRSNIGSEANAIINKLKFGIGGASFRIGDKAGSIDTVPFGAFPRKIIEKVGGMREDLARGEDNEFNSRIRKAGYIIYFDPRIICTYYARPDLKSSSKQMFQNGVSIARLLYIDQSSIGLRHLVPLAFVLSLIITFFAGIFYHSCFWIFCIVLGLYLIASLIATIDACSKYGFKYFFILPVFFICIHISYGIGTLIGLMRK